MVSVLAFYSDDPDSNPPEVYSFYSVKLFEKNENKQKRAREGQIKKKYNVKPHRGHTDTWNASVE